MEIQPLSVIVVHWIIVIPLLLAAIVIITVIAAVIYAIYKPRRRE